MTVACLLMTSLLPGPPIRLPIASDPAPLQVQSSWFPLVDRNPQTFCDIRRAAPEDFRNATQRICREADAPSAVRVKILPVVN